ncbi:MAG TPA: M6 family metalloprotease domain-containing protein [Pirellulaceae bacterium]|jgi:M6 family metalloprotease-like protein|nr:M6 family metalloprotease domain-containing protein [Pirellulaceae bacterium]
MARFAIGSLASLALVIASGAPLLAAPPQSGEIAAYKSDGSYAERLEFQKSLGNDQYAPELIERAKAKLQRASLEAQGVPQATIQTIVAAPPGNPNMPSTGMVKIPCVLIEFSDLRPATINTRTYIQNALFGSGVPAQAPYESLTAYYDRASFGKLEFEGNTLGWYRTAYPRSQVQQDTLGRQNLIKEALTAFDASHDFSQYDNDNDGDIDYLLVIYAGDDTGWGSFWWAYQTSWWNDNFTIDGKRMGTYVFQFTDYDHTGPFRPLVVIHETGHALGLPDLYDYDDAVGPRGGTGGLDIMDGNRGDHNGFHKWLLEWSTPQVIGGGAIDRLFRPAATSGDGALVMKGADVSDPYGEFFFVENRSPAGNDAGSNWPGSGLMIWHIDSTLNGSGNGFAFNNSTSAHKLLRVMEADGLEEIERPGGGGAGDSGDFWKFGQAFNLTSSPSSRKYDGSPSEVTVTNIRGHGSAIGALVGVSNGEPIVDPIAAQTIECTGEHNLVTLATKVQDLDGDRLKVEWFVGGVLKKSTTNVTSGSTVQFQYDYPHGASSVVVQVNDGFAPMQQQATTVTVQDTTDPVITVAPSLLLSTDPGVAYASKARLPLPQVSEACDGAPVLTSDAPDTFALGPHTINWTVRDFSGNESIAAQTFTVVDQEAPLIFAHPAVTARVEHGETYAALTLPRPNAGDNVGPVTVTGDERVRYPVGITVVTWTATDAAGNTKKALTRVTVVNRPPIAKAGRNRVVETNWERGAVIRLNGAASSDPDGHDLTHRWHAVRSKFSDRTSKNPKVRFPVGRTKVTLTVIDEAGKMDKDILYVTVRLKRSGGRRPRGAEANQAFAEATSTALDDVAEGPASEASLDGYRHAAAAEGYGAAAGEFVRWEAGQSESDAMTGYLELRYLQALHGEQALDALVRAYAESGDEAALQAALQAARGVQAAQGDLIAP